MKTVLIYVYDSNIVRNILRTNILSTLTASPQVAKVVLLVHALKMEEYQKEFTHPKIVFDSYPPNRPSKLEWTAWFLIRQTIPTNNVRLKIDEILDRSLPARLRLPKYLCALFVHTLSKWYPLRMTIRAFLRLPFRTESLAPLVKKHTPDLAFLPTIYDINDIRLLKYCTSKGIPTVGMVKSWDNLLGKDALIVPPDHLVVHNELVKRHAVELAHYPEERIFISGIPQFDVYADPEFTSSREEFFKEMGLNPAKKVILYACMGAWINLHELEMIQIVADLVAKNSFAYPTQLLVRLHPAYLSDDHELKKLTGVILDRPGQGNFDNNPWKADWEFSTRDTHRLANTLKWSDVIIHSGSTMSIDAVSFDLPIVNVGYDGYTKDEKYERSARRLLKKDHYKPIVASGGVTVVNDTPELITAVDSYFKDRSLHREGRQRIVSEQIYKLDGKAGERIGNFILSCL